MNSVDKKSGAMSGAAPRQSAPIRGLPGLVNLVGAGLQNRDHPTRQLAAVAVVTVVSIGILLMDWVVWPGQNIDTFYAVPGLTALPRTCATTLARVKEALKSIRKRRTASCSRSW